MRKLLIVDDDAGLTKAYARIGIGAGFEVHVVNDPLNATEAFPTFKPDVAIIDMIMPEKDGIDVLNEVPLTGQPARIIVTSGHGDAMLRLATGLAEFHASGRVSVLKKPIRRTELEQLLNETPAD
ncbi:MAG TPA: response regulator [Acetobacteraceae bacterium]|jgi:two-component system response regulator MtrA|nr:response regulator [Acetobacteraceae bacterium]